MAINVTVKPNKTTISSVTTARTANLSIRQLNDVETTGATDGQTLVYESGSGKFVAKDTPTINGGTF